MESEKKERYMGKGKYIGDIGEKGDIIKGPGWCKK